MKAIPVEDQHQPVINVHHVVSDATGRSSREQRHGDRHSGVDKFSNADHQINSAQHDSPTECKTGNAASWRTAC